MSQGNLGQFILNAILLIFTYVWKYVSKAYTIVENTENDTHLAFLPCLFLKADGQFIILIAHRQLFSPWLFPCLIFCGEPLFRQFDVITQ